MTSWTAEQDGQVHAFVEGADVDADVVNVCLISINFDTNINYIVHSICTENLEAYFIIVELRIL